jgi:hypothetical protein
VPYSRRDEMALEYFVALLDVIVFLIILILATTVSAEDDSMMDSMAIGLIVVQCIGFACYLVNRMLIIVHAFAEVVCPGCSAAPAPKKTQCACLFFLLLPCVLPALNFVKLKAHLPSSVAARRSNSRSITRQLSMNSDASLHHNAMLYPVEGKYYMDGDVKPDLDSASGGDHHGMYYGEGGMDGGPMMPPHHEGMGNPGSIDGRSASRNARAGVAIMFPAIAEETDSQAGSPPGMSPPAFARLPSGKVGGGAGPSDAPGAPATASRAAGRAALKSVLQEDPEDADVFDRFWKSL